MSVCKYNPAVTFCKDKPDCVGCEDYKPTNADRIRAMSTEELAGFIYRVQEIYKMSAEEWADWLQQPAEEVDHDF